MRRGREQAHGRRGRVRRRRVTRQMYASLLLAHSVKYRETLVRCARVSSGDHRGKASKMMAAACTFLDSVSSGEDIFSRVRDVSMRAGERYNGGSAELLLRVLHDEVVTLVDAVNECSGDMETLLRERDAYRENIRTETRKRMALEHSLASVTTAPARIETAEALVKLEAEHEQILTDGRDIQQQLTVAKEQAQQAQWKCDSARHQLVVSRNGIADIRGESRSLDNRRQVFASVEAMDSCMSEMDVVDAELEAFSSKHQRAVEACVAQARKRSHVYRKIRNMRAAVVKENERHKEFVRCRTPRPKWSDGKIGGVPGPLLIRRLAGSVPWRIEVVQRRIKAMHTLEETFRHQWYREELRYVFQRVGQDLQLALRGLMETQSTFQRVRREFREAGGSSRGMLPPSLGTSTLVGVLSALRAAERSCAVADLACKLSAELDQQQALLSASKVRRLKVQADSEAEGRPVSGDAAYVVSGIFEPVRAPSPVACSSSSSSSGSKSLSKRECLQAVGLLVSGWEEARLDDPTVDFNAYLRSSATERTGFARRRVLRSVAALSSSGGGARVEIASFVMRGKLSPLFYADFRLLESSLVELFDRISAIEDRRASGCIMKKNLWASLWKVFRVEDGGAHWFRPSDFNNLQTTLEKTYVGEAIDLYTLTGPASALWDCVAAVYLRGVKRFVFDVGRELFLCDHGKSGYVMMHTALQAIMRVDPHMRMRDAAQILCRGSGHTSLDDVVWMNSPESGSQSTRLLLIEEFISRAAAQSLLRPADMWLHNVQPSVQEAQISPWKYIQTRPISSFDSIRKIARLRTVFNDGRFTRKMRTHVTKQTMLRSSLFAMVGYRPPEEATPRRKRGGATGRRRRRRRLRMINVEGATNDGGAAGGPRRAAWTQVVQEASAVAGSR